jgi:hypothetical protein
LTDLIVNEASLVDRPANERSRVVFWKCDSTDPERAMKNQDPYRAGSASTVTDRAASTATANRFRGETEVEANREGESAADITDYDTKNDLGIMRDGDSWFIVNANEDHVAGPFTTKVAAQKALRARCGYEKRENPMSPWEQIDRLADAMVLKSGEHLTHAQRVAKILSTPQGKALYAEGKLSHGQDFSRLQPEPPRAPIRKRERAWDTIRAKAETVWKSDPLRRRTFEQVVAELLRQHPELYQQYRNS